MRFYDFYTIYNFITSMWSLYICSDKIKFNKGNAQKEKKNTFVFNLVKKIKINKTKLTKS
jgi:hypothetical protein